MKKSFYCSFLCSARDSIFTSPEFQMSLLTTLITPMVYRNWFYGGEYSGYDKNGTCTGEGK